MRVNLRNLLSKGGMFPLSIALLHFLDPDNSKSKDDFIHNYKNLSLFDEIELANVHMELKPHILCRVIKDVEKSLPPKIECIMSPLQKQFIVTNNGSGHDVVGLRFFPLCFLRYYFQAPPSWTLVVLLVPSFSLPEFGASQKWRLCFGY
ncbi:protein CHROMATIN REMODELING 5 isoform X2 [Cucumis melo var. makuwa]|uniref:Protein CHROMATIN REMODELING 5 isoform X2 n=1 Tax=Cucumis melo var. makuwa TaxID=1194695 RepID=A0A5A7TC94_CUCMM|nr:protein CHROMATIN REMODELING 5 isoform X2 [Cucumis melo var. makuwa]TYK18474.1 protein CHROMATIN REMODELING 5 isoform X2 [Cucumis melo var. makuwa]